MWYIIHICCLIFRYGYDTFFYMINYIVIFNCKMIPWTCIVVCLSICIYWFCIFFWNITCRFVKPESFFSFTNYTSTKLIEIDCVLLWTVCKIYKNVWGSTAYPPETRSKHKHSSLLVGQDLQTIKGKGSQAGCKSNKAGYSNLVMFVYKHTPSKSSRVSLDTRKKKTWYSKHNFTSCGYETRWIYWTTTLQHVLKNIFQQIYNNFQ